MKTYRHGINIPTGDENFAFVRMSEIDGLGRVMPHVTMQVKLKPSELTAVDAIRKRAKRILVKRTDAAIAVKQADPEAPINLNVETPGEDNA
jgi:hypothetical protein